MKKIILNIFKALPFKNHKKVKFLILWKIKKIIFFLLRIFNINDLNLYLKISGSDKYNNYPKVYKYLNTFLKRDKVKIVCEIGIGGHDSEFAGGASLLALSSYFFNSKVYGLDIIEKGFLNSNNIKTFLIDQSNQDELDNFARKIEKFDLIIDDGSHFGEHQVNTFKTLFPYLENGGVYIVEDLGGSYTKAFKGDPDFDPNKNMLGFIKDKIHSVNSKFLTKQNFNSLAEYINISNIFLTQDCLIIQKKIKIPSEYLSDHEAFRSLDQLNKDLNYRKDPSGFIKTK